MLVLPNLPEVSAWDYFLGLYRESMGVGSILNFYKENLVSVLNVFLETGFEPCKTPLTPGTA